MACIKDLAPTNPISALLVSSLGDNFFPPYDPNFQPVDHSKLGEEPFLQMVQPGGGKIKPPNDPGNSHISETLTPIVGILGSIFSFFGPLFIVLDVIRAIIDIICAMFNPVPLILTFVDLFVNVIPPLIALYPPLSSILHALNVAKVIVAIAGSMAASLIPIIQQVVDSSLSIVPELSNGNMTIVDSVSVKLCELFQDLANVIGGFGPIKFILELLGIFLSLGAQLPCTPNSPCCTSENCPPIILNPPAGSMIVTKTIEKFTLYDAATSIFGVINLALDPISEVLNTIVNDSLAGIDSFFEDVAGGINGIVAVLATIVDSLNALTFGNFPDSDSLNLDTISFPDFVPDSVNLDLTLDVPEEWKSVVLIEPNMTMEYLSARGTEHIGKCANLKVGEDYSSTELAGLRNYVISPERIASPEPETPAAVREGSDLPNDVVATMRVNMTGVLPSGEEVTVTVPVGFQYPTMARLAEILNIPFSTLGSALDNIGLGHLNPNALAICEVKDATFPSGTTVTYTLIPDEIELLKNNLIGLGCSSDVLCASKALFDRFNSDIDAAAVVKFGDDSEGAGNKNGIDGLDSIEDKINRGVPDLSIIEGKLGDLLNTLQNDPTTPLNPLPIFEEFFDDIADFVDKVLCVGVSSIQSELKVNKRFVLTDGKDRATISLLIKDSGGNDLLVGGLVPGSDFAAEFSSTLGTVGPVEFDQDSGTFIASLSSEVVGVAEVTASFIVRGQTCSRIKEIVDFDVQQQVIEVEFVPERTQFPRVRKQPRYTHSRGGRSRR